MKLLKLLSSKGSVSGEDIARQMNVSRTAVHKQITKLRGMGYEIVGKRKQGYALISRPDIIHPEELEAQFAAAGIGELPIVYAASMASTQTRGRELADQDAAHGTVIIAEEQSGGYGRMKRVWHAPKGGLWYSQVLRPSLQPQSVLRLTLLASLCVCRTLQRLYQLDCRIKWPNDVWVNGKKLSGILTEMSAEVGRVHWVVMGIGINANNALPGELNGQAVSLKEILGQNVDRPVLLTALVAEFTAAYKEFCLTGFATFEKEYNERSLLPGSAVEISTPEGMVAGIAGPIDADGYLMVLMPNGASRRVIAGDVRVRSSQDDQP